MVHIVTAVDVRLATVIPMIETPIGEMTSEPADARDWLRQAQHEAAEELRRTGLAVTTLLKDGDPKHVLLEEAEQWHADCIFVGAKGLSRVQRFLLGSVSAGVAARAHCSVEVVRFE
jgi:nucleotide-binding universal stress UspA family protein